MTAGDEIPMDEFLAGCAPSTRARLQEDILAGRRRQVAARIGGIGEPWAIYELDPERGVARVAKTEE